MKQFKGTVPLMVSLKHEALRERHWLQLMEKTGQYFDMSPARFTLENMFAMQLHKYQEIAEQILTNAIKELQIERGVQAVIETWATMAFKTFKPQDHLEMAFRFLAQPPHKWLRKCSCSSSSNRTIQTIVHSPD